VLEGEKMKIGVISRYPPMEGGVSSEVYWTFKHLAKRVFECVIVTDNWCIDDEYKERIPANELKYLEPQNIKLYALDPLFNSVSFKFNKGTDTTLNLLSLSLEVWKKERPDIWYSHYLFPYGAVACYLKTLTKCPVILRHAGSDLNRLKSPYTVHLIEILKNADELISHDEELRSTFNHLQQVERISIPPEFDIDYKPCKKDKIRIGIVGKLHESKRILELCKALYQLDKSNIIKKDSLEVLYLSNKSAKKILEKYFPEVIQKYFNFYPFIPPWDMPRFYGSCDIIFVGEKGFPIPQHLPRIPAEAMYVGVPTILSDEIFGKYKRILPFLESERDALVVDTSKPEEIKRGLKTLISDPDILSYVSRNSRKIREALFIKFSQYTRELENLFKNKL
jgi:glycosyltransferase involved in cell wall biosynthesis